MSHKWTDEDRRQLAEWHAERVPLAEMAERLGRTQKAIEHQIYGKGVPRCANPRSITELTDDELRWLDAHYKNTKNAKIIARLRVSHSAMHRLAQTRGLYKTRQFVRKTQKAAVAAAYESHKKNGTFPPKGYKIPRSEEFGFKAGESNLDRLTPKRQKEWQEKRKAAWRKNYQRDKVRTLYYGLEQKTNFKFVKQSVAKLNYRYRFRKRGYTLAEDDDNTYIVPNDKSKRSLIMERNAAKYRLKFIK